MKCYHTPIEPELLFFDAPVHGARSSQNQGFPAATPLENLDFGTLSY
jgi:hypothetical protein